MLVDCDTSLAVDRGVFQAAEIDQRTVIAERKADPIMTAAAHRDFHPITARKPERLDLCLPKTPNAVKTLEFYEAAP